jgi:purine-binding chemotaxis protein CheW
LPDDAARSSAADDQASSADVAPETPLAAPPRQRACVVTLGGRPFAVDVRQTREVVMLEALTAVPGAPAPLLGVANLRGSVVGVAEARPLLGLTPQPVAAGSPALVVAAGGLQAAVPIERVIGLDWFDVPNAPADDSRPGAEFATGMIPHGGDFATLLDAGRLLGALCASWTPPASEA